MAEFSGNELLLNDTGNNNSDGDDIAFSGVFQVGPNEEITRLLLRQFDVIQIRCSLLREQNKSIPY